MATAVKVSNKLKANRPNTQLYSACFTQWVI